MGEYKGTVARWQTVASAKPGADMTVDDDYDPEGSATKQIAEVGATSIVLRMQLTISLLLHWVPY